MKKWVKILHFSLLAIGLVLGGLYFCSWFSHNKKVSLHKIDTRNVSLILMLRPHYYLKVFKPVATISLIIITLSDPRIVLAKTGSESLSLKIMRTMGIPILDI